MWKARVFRYAREHAQSVAALRDALAGDPDHFQARFQLALLLGHDAKRLHYMHQMYHAAEGYLAATNELMSLHVSEETRRGAPMAPAILERLRLMQAAHDKLERPPQHHHLQPV